MNEAPASVERPDGHMRAYVGRQRIARRAPGRSSPRTVRLRVPSSVVSGSVQTEMRYAPSS